MAVSVLRIVSCYQNSNYSWWWLILSKMAIH